MNCDKKLHSSQPILADIVYERNSQEKEFQKSAQEMSEEIKQNYQKSVQQKEENITWKKKWK